jgi:hypothetical protein
VLILSAIKQIFVRADPPDVGKSVLEGAQQIMCLFQTAVDI